MTDLPTLPEVDFSTAETAVASAENRAAVALQAAGDGPLYWKGLELRFTPSIKSHFLTLRRLDGSDDALGAREERDAIILLYLATQPADAWNKPADRFAQPLRARPHDWLAAIDQWADAELLVSEMDGAIETIDRLWAIHHATRPDVDEQAGSVLGNGPAEQTGS